MRSNTLTRVSNNPGAVPFPAIGSIGMNGQDVKKGRLFSS